MVQHMDSAAASGPPALVPGAEFLSVVDSLAMVVPVTRVDRGWDNHVEVSVGAVSGWAMTEQNRTISRERFADVVGVLGPSDFDRIRSWISDFLGLSP